MKFNILLSVLIIGLFTNCSRNNFPVSLMEMNNPDYLISNNNWNRFDSTHYEFYFSNTITNASLINRIIDKQEKNINHIAKLMQIENIDTLDKIRMWVFSNDDEKYRKTQIKSSAHCLTPYWSIYYNQDNAIGAHESGHLLSQTYWGYTKTERFDFLLSEGFAFFVDEHGYFDFNFYDKAKEILKKKKYRISNIAKSNSKGKFKEKAFVAGAFVKFLIENYGLDKFVQLWKTIREDESEFSQIYGKSFEALEFEFYRLINMEYKCTNR
jgi:hypothetical protein